MKSADAFSASYVEARAKFLEAADAAGATLQRISHSSLGPQDEALSTDLAWIGPRSAERVLVLISGTHGIEGFCGSGAQIDWLRRGEAKRMPPGTAALLIHAINPYGFAWQRRVNEDNIDLNRNWIDFDAPLPQNSGYAELRQGLILEEYTAESVAAADRVLDAYIAAHGRDTMRASISGGQYDDPQGLMYGGRQASWSRRTQTAIFVEYLGAAARVALVDYHTGLGPWGYAEPIVTLPPHHPAFLRARSWYGSAVTSTLDGSSSSVAIAGDALSAAQGLLPHTEVTAVAFECGIKPDMEVLAAMRVDCWLHRRGDPLSPLGERVRAQVRSAFYGEGDTWKGMAAGQSLAWCRQALAGLQL